MKLSFMIILLLLSMFLYQPQGIRLEKLSLSASNHQEFITKSSSSFNGDEGLTMATDHHHHQVSPAGINRKLMTKTIASTSTPTNKKNYKIHDPKSDVKFTHGRVGNEEIFSTSSTPKNPKHKNRQVVLERYLDDIDITGMDYSPAKRKPPIHN